MNKQQTLFIIPQLNIHFTLKLKIDPNLTPALARLVHGAGSRGWMIILVILGYTVSRWHRACTALRIHRNSTSIKEEDCPGSDCCFWMHACMHAWFSATARTVRATCAYVRLPNNKISDIRPATSNSNLYDAAQLATSHPISFHPSPALSSATIYLSSQLVHLPFPLNF